MSKPYIHSKSSVHKFGGEINDYLSIHQYMDSSKAHIGDNRHRTIFHTSFGCFIMEDMFGVDFNGLYKLKEKYNLSDEVISDILIWKEKSRQFGKNIKNSNNREISVRDIAEQHVLEDFGMKKIPCVYDYIKHMEIQPWMSDKG